VIGCRADVTSPVQQQQQQQRHQHLSSADELSSDDIDGRQHNHQPGEQVQTAHVTRFNQRDAMLARY